MDYDDIKNGLGIFIACLGAYTSYLIFKDISGIYAGWQSFFSSKDSVYPMLITAFTALAPISCFLLAYFVFVDKFKKWLVLPLVHVLIVFFNFLILFGCVLLVLWWIFKNRLPLEDIKE